MQNRYVGDIGDFVKYGLLNFILENRLTNTKLKLGVNWYLVPDEKHNEDGKYIDYLRPSKRFSSSLQQCNPKLYRQLKEIVFNKKVRNVTEIERGEVLPKGTIFLSKLIKHDPSMSPSEKVRTRESWHSAALKGLMTSDIVFLDPDNGVQTEKLLLTRKKSSKYVLFGEVADYYKRGQSVIMYSHRVRQKEPDCWNHFNRLKELSRSDNPLILTAYRYTIRDFVFLPQPRHRKMLENSLANFENEWNKNFKDNPFKFHPL